MESTRWHLIVMASAKGCETVKSEETLIAEATKAFSEVRLRKYEY